MDRFLIFSFIIVCFCKHGTNSLNLPGPLVYVVTPSPRPPHASGEARAAPFYYHNWMRRMDSPKNSTTTTIAPKTKTPDLIFAEFESGNKMKSIRKLLEKEKVETKSSTTSTSRPIYVPDETNDVSQHVKYTLTMQTNKDKKEDTKPVDMTDYFALYNNMYNPNSADLAPVYIPSTTPSTTSTPTSTTTTSNPSVENIWHIIDSQKYDQEQWEEEPVSNEDVENTTYESKPQVEDDNETKGHDEEIDENFALPGFASNPGNGAENESRAIRTEPNMRFPYVNLKPFQMKTRNKPAINSISNGKKGNNMFSSLDNFYEMKEPVRGEAQDVIPKRQLTDRYNPAQPYLPSYDTKSKQSSPSATPTKVIANLVPPPPPPPPRITDNDFPAPISYESFPPYAPSNSPANPLPPSPPASPAPVPKPVLTYQPPIDMSDDSGPPDTSASDSDGLPIGLGYRYKPPSPPSVPFLPTIPPPSEPFDGYSYMKPPMINDSPPPDMDDKPDFQGYHYSKPDTPSPPDHPPAKNGHDTPSYGHNYPDLVFDHDFDADHDYHHHHHHHPTTTTTTEMPRVNRYSYYYLGKKLYYLPLYFSVYFIIYVGALIIKAVLRHKIVYPNSWRPNDQTASFFSKRSVDSWDLSNENLHEITGKVTHAIAVAGEKYFARKKK